MSESTSLVFDSIRKSYPAGTGLSDWLRRPFSARNEQALRDVSFELDCGQVVGVVGHNGAGKTTLLKLLCDLLSPDAGQASVLGYRLPEQGGELRTRVGYVPSDERSFFWRLSGRANLEFFAGMYNIPRRQAARRIDELLDTFGLAGKAGGHFRDYSSGMRKRLAIVRGLLHEPRMLVMDEPTNSLDPYWGQFLGEYVREWVRQDPARIVVWSTHRLEEIPNVCDSIICLKSGRLQYCGTVEGFAPLDDLALK